MAVGYTSTNANKRSSFDTLMKSYPEIKRVCYDTYKQLPQMIDKYLLIGNSTKSTEKENAVGGRPEWTTKTEAAEFTFGDYAEGTEVTYTHLTYADAFDVSQEMMEDNQWKTIMRQAREMAKGGYAAVENNAADTLNNAFTSGTGADGSYLCVTDHDLINSASTGSNAMTTVLSAGGLEDAYVLARSIVNESNIIVPTQFDTLVVPPSLERTAEELKGSTLTPENSNNATNIYGSKIKKIIVNPYLSSSTAWFLIDSSSESRPRFYWRVKPEFYNDSDVYSENFLMKARSRFSYGFTEWQGVIGSTGV